jgi:hypothetical protein
LVKQRVGGNRAKRKEKPNQHHKKVLKARKKNAAESLKKVFLWRGAFETAKKNAGKPKSYRIHVLRKTIRNSRMFPKH